MSRKEDLVESRSAYRQCSRDELIQRIVTLDKENKALKAQRVNIVKQSAFYQRILANIREALGMAGSMAFSTAPCVYAEPAATIRTIKGLVLEFVRDLSRAAGATDARRRAEAAKRRAAKNLKPKNPKTKGE